MTDFGKDTLSLIPTPLLIYYDRFIFFIISYHFYFCLLLFVLTCILPNLV